MTKCDNIFNKFVLIIITLLSISVCITEPLSRHCMKIALLMALIKCIMDRSQIYRLKEIRYLLLSIGFFILVMFISCIYGGHFIEEVSKYKFLMHYNALIVPACMLLVEKDLTVKKLLYGMFIGLLATDAYIFYQSWNGVHRPFSFLKWSIMLGTMLYVILIPAMEIMIFSNNTNKTEKIFCVVSTILSLAAFICLNTRGAWLALFPVCFMILMYYLKNWKSRIFATLCIALCAVAALAVFPSFLQRVNTITVKTHTNQQSVNERYLMWGSAIKIGLDNPILGVGMGNYTEKYQKEYIDPEAKESYITHAHNNFFQFFAETGSLGLLSYCVMLITFFVWSWKRRRNHYAMIIFMSTLALMLYSLTDYTFEAYSGMRVYWLLVGVCATGICIEDKRTNMMINL